jgi:hypothetical protein
MATPALRARGSSSTRFSGAKARLLGRTTYDVYAEAWPEREGAYANKLNGFGDPRQSRPLRLVDSRAVGEGVAILVYEPDHAA